MARYAQITQNNKFAISLQYFKKEVSDVLDFFACNKDENSVLIDTMINIKVFTS